VPTLTVKADFLSNGMCSYRVYEDDEQIDYSIAGAVTWAELLTVIAGELGERLTAVMTPGVSL
jgi:hypothetical protein